MKNPTLHLALLFVASGLIGNGVFNLVKAQHDKKAVDEEKSAIIVTAIGIGILVTAALLHVKLKE